MSGIGGMQIDSSSGAQGAAAPESQAQGAEKVKYNCGGKLNLFSIYLTF